MRWVLAAALVIMAVGAAWAQTPLDYGDPSITTKPTLDGVKSRSPPKIPPDMRKGGFNGEAKFRLCLDATGHVTSHQLVQSTGEERLDKAAADWLLKGARFTPAKTNEKAVAVCNYNMGYVWRFGPPKPIYPSVSELPANDRPKLISIGPEPAYPAQALEKKAQGKVKLSLCVDAAGKVENLGLLKPRADSFLEAATLKWAATAIYSPAMKDGEAAGVCGVEIERDWKAPN